VTPDEATIALLQEHLGLPVRLVSVDDPALSGFVQANEIDGDMRIRNAEEPADRCEVAVRLPSGAWAAWEAPSEAALFTLNHAKTTLLLQSTDIERNQLLSEADALATQVVNDFEELSLLRSLASAVELPDSSVALAEMTSNCLRPLAEGIAAQSIAAVFIGDDDSHRIEPIWSGERLADDAVIKHLINEYRREVEDRPIVRNRSNGFKHAEIPESIQEFVLLQCRSEGRLHGWLLACNRITCEGDDLPWAQRGFTTVQASLLETASHQLAAQVHNMRLLRQKEALYTDVVRALVNAVEARDPYTSGHSERVARFAKCLGKALGENEAGCDRLYLTGLLHDVGKIAVPDGVLRKPGHLDEQERAIIETHTEAGWRILHELEALRDVLPGVLYHHEHFDGKGYPDGLVGENIPLDGRILAVCDAFDAMTSDRPYRDGMPIEKAVGILRGGSGHFWDPRLIEAFIENIEDMDQIRLQHRPRKHAARPTPIDGQPVT